MKKMTKLLTAFAATALLATGCINEDPAYLNPENPDKPGNETKGFLSLGDVALRVVVDAATDSKEESTAEDTTRPQAAGTRAGDEVNVDAFIVKIINSAHMAVVNTTYAELKTLLATPYELPVGSYTLTVSSEQTAATTAQWDHPVYGTSQEFAITKGATTTLPEIVCTLQNIKVTMSCAADLKASLTTDTKSTISVGDQSLEFGLEESRAGYYMPVAALNTINFHLEGKFIDNDRAVQFTKKISNVKAGQWRKINLIVTYSSNGGISFDIKVDSYVQEEEITINGTESLWEPLLDDEPVIEPGAPKVVWTDHDLSETFQLKASMFDADNKCIEPFDFVMTADNGIKSMIVTISSTNTTFMESVNTIFGGSSFDLCELTPGTTAAVVLQSLGFPIGNDLKGKTSKPFNLQPAMPMLYLNPGYEGTHTFAFSLEDNEGLTGESALNILVDKANESGTSDAPTIVWTDKDASGAPIIRDMSQRYDLNDTKAIDLTVTAPAGVKSFVVTITSLTLEPFLTDPTVNIPTTFDLCTVEGTADDTETTAGKLKEFGFSIHEEVKDVTTPINFSITPFISLLNNAVPAGDHDFELKVTDNNDQTTTKTLMLVRSK